MRRKGRLEMRKITCSKDGGVFSAATQLQSRRRHAKKGRQLCETKWRSGKREKRRTRETWGCVFHSSVGHRNARTSNVHSEIACRSTVYQSGYVGGNATQFGGFICVFLSAVPRGPPPLLSHSNFGPTSSQQQGGRAHVSGRRVWGRPGYLA